VSLVRVIKKITNETTLIIPEVYVARKKKKLVGFALLTKEERLVIQEKARNAPRKKPVGPHGFAKLPEKVRKGIARRGGLIVQQLGKGYQWTTETAQEAGRKGGLQKAANRRNKQVS
jgi:general stress protein YciG